MKKIPLPEEIRRLWPRIIEAANDIGGWFEDYSNGYGFGSTDDAPSNGVTSSPPEEILLFKSGRECQKALDDKKVTKSQPLGTMRDWSERGLTRKLLEIHIGTFAIFSCTRKENRLLNVGYEDTAGTDNERFVVDGDTVVVVYMM